MRVWTDEERDKQSKIIHRWKPWLKSTGAKSVEGKAKSAQNSRVHGLFSAEWKHYHRACKELGKCLKGFYEVMDMMYKHDINVEDIKRLEKKDKMENFKVDKIIKDIQQRAVNYKNSKSG